MPKIFANVHHRFMQSYFDKSKGNAMGVERDVFAMSKEGYIIPCTLLIKIMPSLANGIQILSFLNEKESTDQKKDSSCPNNYILYGEKTGVVYGISKSCYEYFNIKPDLCFGKCSNMSELTLEMICPEILDQKAEEEYTSNSGIVVELDTTQILAKYPFDDEGVDDLEDEKKMLDLNREYQEIEN